MVRTKDPRTYVKGTIPVRYGNCKNNRGCVMPRRLTVFSSLSNYELFRVFFTGCNKPNNGNMFVLILLC